MITAELIVDTRYKSKKGYSVKIRVYDGKEHKYTATNFYQSVKKFQRTPEVLRFEAELSEMVSYANKNGYDIEKSIELFNTGLPKSNAEEIQALIKRLEELQAEESIGFIEFLDIRVEELKALNRPHKAYLDVRSQIVNYIYPNEDLRMNDITYEWLSDFVRYKQKMGAKTGINTYLNTMRAIFKEAQRRTTIKVKLGNPFLGLQRIPKEKVEYRSGAHELRKLFEYEFRKGVSLENQKNIQRVIDITLFQFAIGGHDLVDVRNLKWENISKGRVRFQRHKLRNKNVAKVMVDNKLNDFALSVIEKWGNKNSDRVFSFFPEEDSVYIDTRGNWNRSLRRICQHLGIEILKSKAPRYIFRSLAGEQMVDIYAIHQIQGHAIADVSFGYQRGLPYDVLDSEMDKVLKLVFD